MIYVGQTVSLRNRLISYMRYEYENKHGGLINDSFRTFGFNAHTFQILEMNVPIDKLSEKEEYWIRKLNTVHFINPAGMNKNRFDKKVGSRIKNKINYKEPYQGLEEWDFKPFTGAEFLEKTKELKKQLTVVVNKRTDRKFPKWATDSLAEKLKKKIVCYDVNGDYVATYPSTIDAVNILGIPRSSIKDSLRKGSWSRGKYMFIYWQENLPMKIEVDKVTKYSEKKPVLVFNEFWELIAEYPSAMDTGRAFAIKEYKAKKLASKRGLEMLKECYRFVYKEDYDSLNPSEMGGGDKIKCP